ncbi:Carbohydrate sulfotransferase 1 [Oryzias melastigma]|uniref:Sulfotransferase n=1 Tax=Oryzias melastigma TaxID=30732 RepID=A0A834CAA4_ORYME|nr:Carbohydrate sulfotransferase 1 [Oryzias melastigma]
MTAFADQFRAWKIWNVTGRQPRYVDLSQITSTCKDMAASAETGLQGPAWLHGRYLLVRYEDLALHPETKATEIYRFVGLEMDQRVRTWISKNTNSNASAQADWNYRYSTSRDSRATAENWRLRLGFDCGPKDSESVQSHAGFAGIQAGSVYSRAAEPVHQFGGEQNLPAAHVVRDPELLYLSKWFVFILVCQHPDGKINTS